jgi:Mechanosensitive ion channel
VGGIWPDIGIERLFDLPYLAAALVAAQAWLYQQLLVPSTPNLTPSVQVLFTKLLKIVLVTIAVVAALGSVGIDLTAFAVFSGAVGVGIGFGLQKVVANLISGVILLLDRSVKPGDVIAVGQKLWLDRRPRRALCLGGDAGRHRAPDPERGADHEPGRELVVQQQSLAPAGADRDQLRRGRAPRDAPVPGRRSGGAARARAAGAGLPADRLRRQLGRARAVLLDQRPAGGHDQRRSAVLLGVWDRFHEHGIEIPFPQRDLHIRTPSELRLVTTPAPADGRSRARMAATAGRPAA